MSIELGLSRFKNVDGISCYMISVLHILQQIPDFTNYLINLKKIKKTVGDSIFYELARAIKLSLDNDNIRIAPKSFKKKIGEKDSMWSELEHQDSQEFYTFLMSNIEKEWGYKVISIPKIPSNINDETLNNSILRTIANNYIFQSERVDYSPFKNLFVGYLISNIKCSICDTNSPSFESFLNISLSIPIKNHTNVNAKYGLEECLDNFVNDEQLDKENLLTCDICGFKNQSFKKIQIWKAPNILVIQLKRFVTNQYGIQTSKIINPVIYPTDDFDISNYYHPDSPYKNNAKYKLIGVNVHLGFGISGINAGHYISIVRNRHDNKWYVFDDANNVIEINEDSIQNRNAYLLFYLKVD
jgi:ubiquitin C-terminal hydrolase